MTYTQEYERWFRDVGQFLEPAGDLQNAGKLDLLKQWGASVYEYKHPEIEAAKDESIEAAKAQEKAENELDDLKSSILRRINDDSDSPSAVVEEIGKLVGA